MKKADGWQGDWEFVSKARATENRTSGNDAVETVFDESPFAWIADETPSEANAAGDAPTENLSALDAGFLFLESPTQNFQIGFVALLDASPGYEALAKRLETNLETFPRLRQMPTRSKLDLGWPFWRDDPDYALSRHLHHIAVPRPGDAQALSEVLETLSTTTLPTDRPRWEVYLIEGLEHGRAALFCKVHHCMSDGIGGFHVLKSIADAEEEESIATPLPTPKRDRDTVPEFKASSPQRGIAGLISDAIADPRGTLSRGLRDFAEAAETIAGFVEEPPALMPWNGNLGQGRKLVWRSYPIDEFESLKVASEGTINDAVLAIVAGALRAYSLHNGMDPTESVVRCIVPASVRSREDEGQMGNQVTAMFPRLPVEIEDPVERLSYVRDEMRKLKDRKQARAASMVLAIAGALPAVTESSVLNVASSLSVANTLCTNIPGPRSELQICGRKITELHAIAPLFLDVGVAFAVNSYADRISICAVVDPALAPDAECIGHGLDTALYETRRALWSRSEALSIASRLTRGPSVAELMAREVTTVGIDESLQKAHDIMRLGRLSHLPVIDGNERLIGVLTERQLLFGETQTPFTDNPAPSNPATQASAPVHSAIGSALDEHVTTASPNEPAAEARRRMAELQIDSLPVVDDDGRLLGLVTENHIARWTARGERT